MRSAAIALGLIAVLAAPALADDDDRKRNRRGQRISARDGIASIFGGDRGRQQRDNDDDDDDRRRGRVNRDRDDDDDDDDDNDRGRRIVNGNGRDRARARVNSRNERSLPIPNRRGDIESRRFPFDSGYQDGQAKGREDALNGRGSDPAVHAWYRNGDRGYNSRYGSREDFRSGYREGFLSGYREGYRGNVTSRENGRWWPF